MQTLISPLLGKRNQASSTAANATKLFISSAIPQVLDLVLSDALLKILLKN